MKRSAEVVRLKAMLTQDKSATPNKFTEVLKTDMLALLRNYFELSPKDIVLQLHEESGQLFVEMLVRVESVKRFGAIEA
ncbi:MAG: cell division topological specificity factor MinE [Clostridia bacterium]|nr:cell division topological specificity factor MinE [Clostridia bacterium]